MTLDLYVARRFGSMLARVFMVFLGIMMLIEVIDQLRRFSGQGTDISFGQAIHLAALNVPESLYRILPLITILAAIALFLSLARSSELVVVRAAGQSGLRFLVTPVLAALATGGLAVAVLNPLVAATIKQYDVEVATLANGGASVLSVNDDGLWLRQGRDGGQTVVHAARANADGTQLFGVSFQSFGSDGVPLTRVEAETARLVPGAWELAGAKSWDFAAPNPEAMALTEASTMLASDLTPDAIRDSFGKPAAIAIWSLPTYIAGLERAGFSARNHRVWLQSELALPLLLAAMVLLAAGFTMRHSRAGKSGLMVLFALLGGLAIFFLRNFAQVLGDNGQIPVVLAAWGLPIAATLLALGLLLHQEDG